MLKNFLVSLFWYFLRKISPTLYFIANLFEWIKRPLVWSGHYIVLVRDGFLFLSRTQMVRSRFSNWWLINIPNKWTRFFMRFPSRQKTVEIFKIFETTVWNFRKLKVLIPIPPYFRKNFRFPTCQISILSCQFLIFLDVNLNLTWSEQTYCNIYRPVMLTFG